MSEMRYSRAAVAADLVRSGAGSLLTGAPLVAAAPPLWLTVILAGLLILFLSHMVTTVLRGRQRYRMDEQALHVLPSGITIAWANLDEVHLDYFSTRRDGRAGWMQLRLRCGPRRLRLDSGLMGFETVVRRAVSAARERGLELPPTTSANLAFLEGDSPERSS